MKPTNNAVSVYFNQGLKAGMTGYEEMLVCHQMFISVRDIFY